MERRLPYWLFDKMAIRAAERDGITVIDLKRLRIDFEEAWHTNLSWMAYGVLHRSILDRMRLARANYPN